MDEYEPLDDEIEPTDGDDAREVLRRLLGQADEVAGQLADDAARRQAEREAEFARELAEVDELRTVLADRIEAANERFGSAQRLVEESRLRLTEIDEFHRSAQEALRDATESAARIVADAEAQAAALQGHAEREAVSRVRRGEREAADCLIHAEAEAQRLTSHAAAALQEAEQIAAEKLAAADREAEVRIDEAMQARHDDVERVQEAERLVQDRIRALLATDQALSSVPRADSRWSSERRPGEHTRAKTDPDAVDAITIDLTDADRSAVSDAIRGAIDEWVNRRDER